MSSLPARFACTHIEKGFKVLIVRVSVGSTTGVQLQWFNSLVDRSVTNRISNLQGIVRV